MSEWQPIETAPKDGRGILITSPEALFPVVAQWLNLEVTGWHTHGPLLSKHSEERPKKITHWMPLPEPPK